MADFTPRLDSADTQGLRLAIATARRAREHGNHPFGAVLQDVRGNPVLAAENAVITGHDVTAHAETSLVRAMSAGVEPELIAGATVYCSAEPCPMCAGALVWAGIRRVVFGLGMADIYAIARPPPGAPALYLESRPVFAAAPWPVVVIGPALEDEARVVHVDFW